MRVVWAVMLAVLGASVARADVVTFNFFLGGSVGEPEPYTTQGVFTGVDLGPRTSPYGEAYEAYRVTGATGELAAGVSITGLLAAGTYRVDPFDVYTVGDEFDVITEYAYPNHTPYLRTIPDPVGFTLSNGDRLFLAEFKQGYGLASDPPDFGLGYTAERINFDVDAPVVVATAATPEPGTMGLLGTGVLGVVGMVRRRVRGGV